MQPCRYKKTLGTKCYWRRNFAGGALKTSLLVTWRRNVSVGEVLLVAKRCWRRLETFAACSHCFVAKYGNASYLLHCQSCCAERHFMIQNLLSCIATFKTNLAKSRILRRFSTLAAIPAALKNMHGNMASLRLCRIAVAPVLQNILRFNLLLKKE